MTSRMTCHARSRTTFLRATALAMALATAALACARPVRIPAAGDSAAAPAESRTPARAPDVDVVVENHNSSDVTVTLQGAGGRRVRLGNVSGSTTRTLRFAAELAAASQPLVLLAHPIGARETFTSERFTVQPGQQVVLTLGSRIGQSSVSVH